MFHFPLGDFDRDDEETMTMISHFCALLLVRREISLKQIRKAKKAKATATPPPEDLALFDIQGKIIMHVMLYHRVLC